MVFDVLPIIEPAARHAGPLQQNRDPVAGRLLKDPLDDPRQLLPVLHAVRVRREARIGGQFGHAQHLTQRPPVVVMLDADRQVLVIAAQKRLVRRRGRARAPQRPRLAPGEVLAQARELHGQRAPEQGHVDALPAPSHGTVEKRLQDPADQHRRAAVVDMADVAAEFRRAAILPLDAAPAGEELHHRIRARPLRQRAGSPPRGHVAVDDPRVQRREVLVPQMQPLRHTRAHVVEKDVGLSRQRVRECEVLGVAQVEQQRFLPAVEVRVSDRPSVLRRRPVEHDVAVGRLDLQDLRSQFGEHAAGAWTGPRDGQIKHTQPRQRTRRADGDHLPITLDPNVRAALARFLLSAPYVLPAGAPAPLSVVGKRKRSLGPVLQQHARGPVRHGLPALILGP